MKRMSKDVLILKFPTSLSPIIKRIDLLLEHETPTKQFGLSRVLFCVFRMFFYHYMNVRSLEKEEMLAKWLDSER